MTLSHLLVTISVVFILAFDDRSTKKNELTPEESSEIRKIVYSGRLWTAIPKDGPYTNITIVIVPEAIEEIYLKKPFATLKLLHCIAEGAAPRESIIAIAYFFSLAEGPPVGSFMAYESTDKFDQHFDKEKKSRREHYCKQLFDWIDKYPSTK